MVEEEGQRSGCPDSMKLLVQPDRKIQANLFTISAATEIQ